MITLLTKNPKLWVFSIHNIQVMLLLWLRMLQSHNWTFRIDQSKPCIMCNNRATANLDLSLLVHRWRRVLPTRALLITHKHLFLICLHKDSILQTEYLKIISSIKKFSSILTHPVKMWGKMENRKNQLNRLVGQTGSISYKPSRKRKRLWIVRLHSTPLFPISTLNYAISASFSHRNKSSL